MAIVASELIFYLSSNMPENDTAASGGAVNTASQVSDLPLASASTLEVISSAAGDTTQTITVTGRNSAGAIISDTKTLNGTSAVAISGTFERVLKVVLSATAAGTVTLRVSSAGATVVAILPGRTLVRRRFYDSASESSPAVRYELHYAQNTNGSLTLTNAKVRLTADPAAKIKIGLGAAVGDLGTVTNRKTAPSGVTFSDDGVDLNVPGGQLAAGQRIGIWVEQSLLADDAALKSTYTTQLSGTST